jgi:hypothetical protein
MRTGLRTAGLFEKENVSAFTARPVSFQQRSDSEEDKSSARNRASSARNRASSARNRASSARNRASSARNRAQTGQKTSWSILAFDEDVRAPSIPRFSAEWVGYQ